jgi:hypothetical protein
MRVHTIPNGAAIALLAAALAGCSADSDAPPMATDGPNQVVLKVPGMS